MKGNCRGIYLSYLEDNGQVCPDVDINWNEESKYVDVSHVGDTGLEDTDKSLVSHAGVVIFIDVVPADVATKKRKIKLETTTNLYLFACLT